MLMLWRLLLEDYGPEFLLITGKADTVADPLSRLHKQGDIG